MQYYLIISNVFQMKSRQIEENHKNNLNEKFLPLQLTKIKIKIKVYIYYEDIEYKLNFSKKSYDIYFKVRKQNVLIYF